MANNGNLKPVLTKEEAKERGRAGGLASVKARRKKRDMRKQLELLMSLDQESSKSHKDLVKLGIPESSINNQMVVLVAMLKKASKGNVKAAEFIRDTLGYNPKQQPTADATVNKVEITDDLPDNED